MLNLLYGLLDNFLHVLIQAGVIHPNWVQWCFWRKSFHCQSKQPIQLFAFLARRLCKSTSQELLFVHVIKIISDQTSDWPWKLSFLVYSLSTLRRQGLIFFEESFTQKLQVRTKLTPTKCSQRVKKILEKTEMNYFLFSISLNFA